MTTRAFRTTASSPPAAPPAPPPAAAPARTPATAGRSRLGAPDVLLGGLLALTAVLYLWGLGASGWANSYYSAAAQAGSESWPAFFFGASDASGSITVDKTPLALWPMALSVRTFGLSSWSILVPQALMGVAAVAVLAAALRRATGSAYTGLLAGLILAVTPVAVLMFRFNNPDALLVLLLVGSAYATLRALEPRYAARWLALAGALVGLAFLAKMLQAFLVLPALALTYLLFAVGVPLGRRLLHLLLAFGSMVVAGGWWVAIVELWPARSRPYIGGSQGDSVLELALGYNGLGRLTGEEVGSVGGQGGWGETGLLRMFDADSGSQIAWLLPAALVLGVAALWFTRGDGARPVRAALTLFLGWLVVTTLVFSLMGGIYHAYYTVALAPAVAVLVAVGAGVLWRRRGSMAAARTLAFTTALSTALAYGLLDRTDWQPWLKYVVAVVGFTAALLLAGAQLLPRRLAGVVAATALVAALAGPTAYSVTTAATPHTGSIVSAGPATVSGFGGGPGGPAGGGPAGAGGTTGSLLQGSTSTSAITALLQTDADSYTWAAAAVGSNSASGYQLASGEPVMALGGFNGSDPSPTLAEFQHYVADGEIHYFVGGGDGGFGGGPGGGMGGMGGAQMGGSDAASEIAAWVAETFSPTTVDGVTVYDLSGGVR